MEMKDEFNAPNEKKDDNKNNNNDNEKEIEIKK